MGRSSLVRHGTLVTRSGILPFSHTLFLVTRAGAIDQSVGDMYHPPVTTIAMGLHKAQMRRVYMVPVGCLAIYCLVPSAPSFPRGGLGDCVCMTIPRHQQWQ
jgi:hypothetical protein